MRKVEVTIEIDTVPERIIQAFTEYDMLHEWWSVERALIQKRRNGIYTLAWNITDRGFGFVSSGTIRKYNARKLLEINNFVYLNPERPILGPMSLTVKAKQKNALTELYLCQDGYLDGDDWDWFYDSVKEAWPVVLNTLKEYLEKGFGSA